MSDALVAEAVRASMKADRNMLASEQNESHIEQAKSSAPLSNARKKRRVSHPVNENWKKLQKTLPKSSRPKRREPRVRVASHATKNDVMKEEDSSQPALSAFMKREVQRTETKTKVVAMDCEMVGVGKQGKQNALARVSLVNYEGDVLYDKFVRVDEEVTDYRTQWSGVRPEDISADSTNAVNAFEAQRAVGNVIKGCVLVGHALKNDLRVLRISHPWRDIRDTSDFFKKVWRKQGGRGGRAPALRVVVAQVLGIDTFQKSEHDSCEDARAALALYKRHCKEWENEVKKRSRGAKPRIVEKRKKLGQAVANDA